MSDFPTIFDWLARAEPLRGYPAAYIVLVAAALVVAIWDWRISLLALTVQYLLAGLLFADVLDPRLAFIKVFVGLFVCLILYLTGRQVNWGRPPADLTAAERARLPRPRTVEIRGWRLPLNGLVRLGLVLVGLLVAFVLANRLPLQIAGMPEHVNLAIYGLAILGLIGMGVTTEPFKIGLAMLLFMTGFELLYNMLEQWVTMLAVLAALNLAIALGVAYLTQRQYRLTFQLEQTQVLSPDTSTR